jgi:deoxyribodipyrimidine photo-lyase
MTSHLEDERIKRVNDKDINYKGRYILYYMRLSSREDFNYALEFGIRLSNEYKKPLIVYTSLSEHSKFSNLRIYKFLIEGMIKTKKLIEERGIKFIIEKTSQPPYQKIIEKSEEIFCLILEKGYLKHQRKINNLLASKITSSVFEVENDVVVPVELVSNKAEPYARTIRHKIYKNLKFFLKPIKKTDPLIKSVNQSFNFNELNFQVLTINLI